MRGRLQYGLVSALGLAASAVQAASPVTLTVATPAALTRAVAAARCGDTIKAVGIFPTPIAVTQTPGCTVTLNLRAATVTKLLFRGAANWTVEGGSFTGAPFMAVQVIGSQHLRFEGGSYHQYGNAGISLLDSSFISIIDNSFTDANADGVDLVSSQDVEFRHNRCTLVYSQKLHADCLQMWNKPGDPQTVARVVADDNECTGNMQCIDAFGAGDPRPVSDVTITNNRAYISTKWGGAIGRPAAACDRCVMSGNVARTFPGMPPTWERPGWYRDNRPEPGNISGR